MAKPWLFIAAVAVSGLFPWGASAGAPPVAVECPKRWPADPKLPLVEQRLFMDDQTQYETVVARHNDPFEEVYYAIKRADLECEYKGGHILAVPIPGMHQVCTATLRRDKTIRIACTFEPTGDAEKDKVEIFVAEPLNRESAFYGVRLGMPAKEAITGLAGAGAGYVRRQGETLTGTIGDDRRVSFIVDGENRVVKIVVDPIGEGDRRYYEEMKRRFGLPKGWETPETDSTHYGATHWLWRTKDGMRLEVQYATPPQYGGYPWQVRVYIAGK